MAFKFNFALTPAEKAKYKAEYDMCDEVDVGEVSLDCDYLVVNEETLKNKNENFSLLKVGDLEIKYVSVNSLKKKISTENEIFSQVNALKTDIIPGKYEGGLKIWEGSIDLANYAAEHIDFKEKDKVLELGCGAGLPGLVAFMRGACVTFQDYNPEVLKYSTLPNTILNTPDDKVSRVIDDCRYIYGDWDIINGKYSFAAEDKFDYILTAETIYEMVNHQKLLEIMKSTLKPDGTIYLAAKTYYFGVGGGIVEFEDLVNFDKTLEIKSFHTITNDGLERQILIMKFRDCGS